MESGHEADFVEAPPKEYECPVCLLVLRKPHLLSCCGKKLCHPCVSRLQNVPGACVCPVCRENFTTMLEKELNRTILGLAVRCPMKDKGCQWIGELRKLNEHTDLTNNGGCQYIEVPCGNSCGGIYSRHALRQHERETCMNRPIDQRVERRMVELCESMQNQLRLECDQKIHQLRIEHSRYLEQLRKEYNQRLCQMEGHIKNAYDKKIKRLENEVLALKMEKEPKDANSKFSLEKLPQPDQLVKPTGINSSSINDPEIDLFCPAVCPVCLHSEAVVDPVTTKCCKQTFCRSCLDEVLKHSLYCPTCKKPLRTVTGNQPQGTMNSHVSQRHLPGYPHCGTITIRYHFPSGTQGSKHPNPGCHYSGTSRTAYLPDNSEGREVLHLLRKAFDAGVVFTIGTSSTTGQKDTVVWNGIHHKTTIAGGPNHYGYPDKEYLRKVKMELIDKGIS